MSVQGTLAGSDATRGKALFTGDGKLTSFTLKFVKPFASEPFVTISTNQFARARLARRSPRDHVTVEFEQPPAAGKENVVVYWMAQM